LLSHLDQLLLSSFYLLFNAFVILGLLSPIFQFIIWCLMFGYSCWSL